MAKRFETTMFGLPIIMRHDYEDKVLQEKLKEYQGKSYNAFTHFLTNVPNFKYDSFLDVGCGDDWVVNMAKNEFKVSKGIDLFIEDNEYDNVVKSDWNTMSKDVFNSNRFNAIFINHSMEHAANVYQLMEQVTSLQKKGDSLFVAVPDGNTPFGYAITSSTTHFSCITEGYLRTTLQRFGYMVEVEVKELRPGARELWSYAIKMTD
jgi:2-polyprenyl-3-methyl-5-hydroxy-6-metoxy-1,4-benzoquinol methylase